jgi:hypothetical protein
LFSPTSGRHFRRPISFFLKYITKPIKEKGIAIREKTEKFHPAEAGELTYGACRHLLRKWGQVRKKGPPKLLAPSALVSRNHGFRTLN